MLPHLRFRHFYMAENSFRETVSSKREQAAAVRGVAQAEGDREMYMLRTRSPGSLLRAAYVTMTCVWRSRTVGRV